MKRSKEIFSQVGVYAGSTFLTQLITLVAAVISRNILGPVQTGIWATLQVIVDYSKYSTMGIMTAINRDIPYRRAKGEEAHAQELKNLAFSFVLASSVLVALGIAAFAFFARHHYQKEIVWGLFLIAAVVVLQRINNVLISLLRAFKQFTVEASQMFLSAIVNAFLVAILTYFFRIYGFIFAMALSLLFNVVYLLAKHPFNFHWFFDLRKLKPLLATGFPLMTLGLLLGVIRSLDRIFIAKYLGFREVGLYSIALMACSFISNFSISFAIVLFPHGQEKFALAGEVHGAADYLKKSSAAYVLIMPMLIGAAAFLAPILVVVFLPQFVSSILALQMLVLSSFFVALFQPYNDFLITIRRHMVLIPFLGGCALASLGLYYWVAHSGWGIVGFSVATCIISFLMFTVLFFMSNRYVQGVWAPLEFYLKLTACFLYLLIFVFFLIKYFSPPQITAAGILCQSGFYVIFCFPLLFLLNRKFSILNILMNKICEGRGPV